jgi:LuxR family transcriptional regulator, quorum-sensing system regulator BjaR1
MLAGMPGNADFFDEIEQIETPYALLRVIREKVRETGLEHFNVMRVPTLGSVRMSDLQILSSWPAELTTAYDQGEFGDGSPVTRRLALSSLPFQFEIEPLSAERSDGKACQVVALFRAHGIARSVLIPVHAPTLGAGAMGYSGDRPALSQSEMTDLHMFSIVIFDRLARLQSAQPKAKPLLSARERECLTWTAEGKTSFEIGKIIGISEHTVNYYLNTASGKLNATNRVQAVAVALRSGLLG